jgi:hypothetical protein
MEPTQADYAWLTKVEAGYIGVEKPQIKRTKEPYDNHSYDRYLTSKRLNIPETELTDEPDYMALDMEEINGKD